MTTKTWTETICDVCGRELSKVNRYECSGSGRLTFTYNCGGAGGGCSNKICFEDICVECVDRLVGVLKKDNIYLPARPIKKSALEIDSEIF